MRSPPASPDRNVRPVASPGQSGDDPYLASLLEAHRRGDSTAFRLLADEAYSHPSTRALLRAKRIPNTIPERSDQIARRKAQRLSRRPPTGVRPEIYRDRKLPGNKPSGERG